MNQSQLKQLRIATDNAIAIVAERKPRVAGAINWADLSCHQAALIITTDKGQTYVEVTIEEASPEAAGEFREAVAKELAKAGWLNISVLTEW